MCTSMIVYMIVDLMDNDIHTSLLLYPGKYVRRLETFKWEFASRDPRDWFSKGERNTGNLNRLVYVYHHQLYYVRCITIELRKMSKIKGAMHI